MNYNEWYEQNYQNLCGHGVWLRGGEINTLAPEQFEERPFRVLFTRLSSYFDTRESFTHQLLYQIASQLQGVFADLAFLPLKQDAQVFSQSNVPWLLGTQSKRGALDFDLIGFSNSITLELINVAAFLKNSAIPLKKSERMQRADVPLLILGGANALYSTAIWGDEPLVDAVFVGESDEQIQQILRICRDSKAQGLTKIETLQKLESVQGLLQPDKPRKIRKAMAATLSAAAALEAGPVQLMEDVSGSSQLQISEGCPCFCSFCAEGWERKPYRERNSSELRQIALRQKANMGLEQLDLYSFNFNQHSQIYDLLTDLVPLFKRVGLKSQRFDLLAHDPQMLEFLHCIDKTSLTCGLEGISARLRRYLHKNLDERDLHASISAIFKSRARELKVFLIATGLEQDSDFDAFSRLLKQIKDAREVAHSHARILFSITPLVRFPWTPMEFAAGVGKEEYRKIMQEVASRVQFAGFEFREAADLNEYLISQVLLRASDNNIREALVEAALKTGFVYYRQMAQEFVNAFGAALKSRALALEDIIKTASGQDEAEKAWWLYVETGVSRSFLRAEFERSQRFEESDYCLGRSWQKASCLGCGACESAESVERLTQSRQQRKISLDAFKNLVAETRSNRAALTFMLRSAQRTRGLPRNSIAMALARALMLAEPELTKAYQGYKGSFYSKEESASWVFGAESFTLEWDRNALERIRQLLQDASFISRVNSFLAGWGTFEGAVSAEWQATRLKFSAQSEFKPDVWLKNNGLKYTLRKTAEGGVVYELNRESAKKGYLKELQRLPGEKGQSSVEVVVGPKFKLHEFMQQAFMHRSPQDWVRVVAESF